MHFNCIRNSKGKARQGNTPHPTLTYHFVHPRGRMMSFMNIECRDDKTDELLAEGRHTKFLPMGFGYEFLFSRLFPFVDAISKVVGKEGKRNDELIEGASKKSLMEHIGELKWSEGKDGLAAATFNVLPIHKNPMGGMHGGCQSVLAQLAAEELRKGSKDGVKEMNMTYMSMGKGEVDVEAVEGGSGDIKVTLRRRKGGGVVSEGVFKF